MNNAVRAEEITVGKKIIHHVRCEHGACANGCEVMAAYRAGRKLVRVGPREFIVDGDTSEPRVGMLVYRAYYLFMNNGGRTAREDRTMQMDRTTHLGHGLTVGQVEDLREEAGRAGDERMVQICQDALEHDRTVLAECARVIADAAAQS